MSDEARVHCGGWYDPKHVEGRIALDARRETEMLDQYAERVAEIIHPAFVASGWGWHIRGEVGPEVETPSVARIALNVRRRLEQVRESASDTTNIGSGRLLVSKDIDWDGDCRIRTYSVRFDFDDVEVSIPGGPICDCAECVAPEVSP